MFYECLWFLITFSGHKDKQKLPSCKAEWLIFMEKFFKLLEHSDFRSSAFAARRRRRRLLPKGRKNAAERW